MRSLGNCAWSGVAALLGFAASVSAQDYVVVPPALATTAGNSAVSIPLGGNRGTYQVLYPPAQLGSIPAGSRIVSMQMRLRNGASESFPNATQSIASYEVKLGSSTRTPGTLSTTFANNIINPVVARSGPMTIAIDSYPAGPNLGSLPEGWGPTIHFSTPYIYSGGPLVIEIRNATSTDANLFADCDSSAVFGGSVSKTTSETETEGVISQAPIVVRLGIEAPTQITLPNAFATVEGTSGNSIPHGHFANGRHLTLYDPSELGGMPPGSIITGMQLRQSNAETAAWPAANSSISDYEVWIGQSPLTPATIDLSFANNLLAPVMVRDGMFDVLAGSYPGGPNAGTTPEGWGPVIQFTTPYVYRGGVLAVDIKSTGGVLPMSFADTAVNSASAAGVSAFLSNGTGFAASAAIARFTFVPPTTSPYGEGVTKLFVVKDFAATQGGTTQTAWAFNGDITNVIAISQRQFETVGPGTTLTGLSFRNASLTAWPTAPVTSDSYRLDIGRSFVPVPQTTGGLAFSESPVTVRSGSLTVPSGAMAPRPPSGTAAFTWEIPFTKPYRYLLNDLLLLGRSFAFAPGASGSVDAISAFTAPSGTEVKAFFASGNANANNLPSAANVPIVRFSADANVILPNASKNGSLFQIGPVSALSGTSTTLQNIIAASELTYIPVGGVITSLEFASASFDPWPNSGGAWCGDYRVEISTAARKPADASAFFADNDGADVSTVYSGPASWLPGSLPSLNADLSHYGARITFDRGFVYKGGDLCVTIRHSGVHSGTAAQLSASPAPSLMRSVLNATDASAISGSFLPTNAGVNMVLGYIPSVVTPKTSLLAPSSGGNFPFGETIYQNLYDPAQVGLPAGSIVTGVALRLPAIAAAPEPSSDYTLDDLTITMSTGTQTSASMSDTFAANEGTDLTIVRSGPYTFEAGSLPVPGTTASFGRFIPFTRPFVYNGGPLVLTLRSGTPNNASLEFTCDVSDSGAIGRRSIGIPGSTTGSSVLALVARFAFTDDAFCPCDLNNDGIVDDLDFQIFVLAYNILDCAEASMAFGCPSDFTHDGIVTDDDFLPFVQAYNAVLCP